MRMSTRALRALIPALVAGVVLVCAGSASAATCTYTASGNWTTGGSCGSTPASTDTVVINSGVTVAVDASHSIAGITMNGGTISFTANNPTITDSGAFTSNSNDTVTGNGTVTVAGTETHPTAGSTLFVLNAADLVLNGPGGIPGGSISVCANNGNDPTDDPSFPTNWTFTIGTGADDVA